MKVLQIAAPFNEDGEDLVGLIRGAKRYFFGLSGVVPDTAYLSPKLYARAKDIIVRYLEPGYVLDPKARIRLLEVELIEAPELEDKTYEIELVDFKTELQNNE